MKKIEIEIPDGKKAEWVDGVLTLIDDKPVEFKFKVGDKVKYKRDDMELFIYHREAVNGEPRYCLVDKNNCPHDDYAESDLELFDEQPKDITERIKTFTDAYNWCFNNEREDLCRAYTVCSQAIDDEDKDILAYLKLRIITCALNEGWEPKFDGNEMRYVPHFDYDGVVDCVCAGVFGYSATKLVLKSKALTKYAATQFRNIYMDFCFKPSQK